MNGDITISAGTLDASTSNYALNIGGNWINNATYTPRTGTVTFDGATQTISGTTATTFHALTISSSVSTTLQTSVSLANAAGANLTISSGSIYNLATFSSNGAGTRTLTINGRLQIGGASNYPTGFGAPSFGTTGSIEYNGANTIIQTVNAITYRDLILTNGSITGSAVKTATAAFTVTGTFTINDGAVFNPTNSSNVITGTGATLTGLGTIIRYTTLTTQYNFTTRNIPPLVVVDGTTSSYAAGTYADLYLVGTTSLSGAVNVTGDLTIISGTFSPGSNTIAIGGNWTNNGTYTAGSSVVTFNGTSKQTISGSSSTAFSSLINSNTSDTLVVNTNITINSGGTLNLNGANTVIQPAAAVVITGTGATITGTGTVRVTRTAATANYASQYTFGTHTLTNLTVDYCANSAQTVTIGGAGVNYGNLVLSGTATKTLSAAITSSNVTGNISVKNGATLANSGLAIAGSGTKTFTLDSNATLSLIGTSAFPTGFSTFSIDTHSTVSFGGGNQTVAARQYGNLSISGTGTKTAASGTHTILGNFALSASTYSASGNNPTLNFGGNFTNSATYTTGTGATIFNGTIQTITGATTFNNLTISSSVSTTLANNITISDATNGNLTISAGSTLDIGSLTANRAGTTTGTRTLTINGKLRMSGASNFPTNFATPTFGSSGTVEYYLATGGQTVSGITYQNLILSNTSGTQTAAAAITVNGTLTMSGGTFNMGTFALSGAGLLNSGTGTIQTQNTTSTPLPAGRTWTQDIVYNSASSQTIVNGSYQNLNASGGNRTLQNSGIISIAGTFTAGTGTYTVTGSTVDFNGSGLQIVPAMSFNNLSISGTKVGSPSLTLYPGTITIAGDFTNTSTGLGTIFTSGSKVDYNGASQNVAALTYGKLSISGTGLKTLTGNTTVNDSITVAGTTGLDGAGYTLTVLGPWINNATYTGSTSTVVFSGLSAQTMSGTVVPTFNSLTVNNTNGVTMSASITVGGALSLSAGKLNVGSNTLTLNGTVSGSASNSLTVNSSSVITLGGSGSGTLYFDQTTPGTTNKLATLTVNRAGNTITLGSDVEVGTALNLTNGKLALGSNTLTISGTLSSTSTNCFVGNGSSSLSITGSGALGSSLYFDQTTAGTTNRLANLSYNRSSQTLTLGNALEITGTITPIAGVLSAGGNLTLVSNASGTARIANGGCTSCSYITGNVKVQRYIPAVARRWRFMGSTVQSTTMADWKGEIYISGSGGVSNGFDASSGNSPTVFWYDETVTTGDQNTGWTAPTNISYALTPGKGFRVFIRGDRSDAGRLNGTVSSQNQVTMELTGVPNQGDITMPVSYTSSSTPANDGWCLVSNPYPSPYDWNAHYDNGSFHHNMDPTIWILSGQSGSYLTYNALSNAGTLTGGIIPAGASFWVKANGTSPTLTFKEQFKVGTTPAGLFKTSEGENFNIKLIFDSITWDGLTIKYCERATANYDDLDTRKLPGIVTLSAYGNDNIPLALSARPVSVTVDTINLNVSGAAGNYRLEFNNNDQMAIADNVLLFDTYTSIVTDLKSASEYSFSIISGVAASQGPNRFYVVVGNNAALPVKLLQFTAHKTGNKQATLRWSTAQETNSKVFEIERSTNGVQYASIGNVAAGGNTKKVINYEFVDNNPQSVNYYRLKQIDLDGSVSYSHVQYVLMDETQTSIKLYPIPATEILTIEHTERIASVRVMDISGRLLLDHEGTTRRETLSVESLKAGVYIIELMDENGETHKSKFIKE